MAANEEAPLDRPRGSRKRKASPVHGESALRLVSDARTEWRFEPTTSTALTLSVVAASLASVALGAGVYGMWLRDVALGPHPYAIYLMALGVSVLVSLALFAPRPARVIRVGDAGIAIENDDGTVRLGWHEVASSSLDDDTLSFRGGPGTSAVDIPVRDQRAAAATALQEARARIPGRMAGVSGDLGPAVPLAGKAMAVEPPQVAGLLCKQSGVRLSFEADVRLCSRCGELYEKLGVPKRCLTCDADLHA